MSSPHPYAPFLHRVEKPARYVGGEFGQVVKEWSATLGRMCLAFPDVYDIGMSHLGFKILYSVLNRHPSLLAERAYAPWPDMERELRDRNEPLRSLESARPLSDFDAVGFSLQFELNFTNILTTLELGGIPLRADDRGDDHPLIVAGGPTATHAEPVAPFLDVIVIGDGEEKTPELLLTWAALRRAGVARRDALKELAKLGGIYAPSLYRTAYQSETGLSVVMPPEDPELPFPVERTTVESLADHPFPSDGPVSSTETIFDRMSVEIARGCTEGCRFCQAGMIYRPVRERSPESILESLRGAIRDGGYDEASLTCLSTADYSAINPLVKSVMAELEKERVSLSVSSLRAYGLDEELLDEIRKVRATGLTFAPEAGSQRMRDVVNKNVTEEQLMLTAERVFARGWSKMKLYFMIGLPTEEESDVREIVGTGQRALEVGRKLQGKRGPKVIVSVSIHVPKPHTPFQWCAMDRREQVAQKQAWLMEEAKRTRVTLRMHQSDASWIEGILARGDRSLADVVETAWRNGARFDSWQEHFNFQAWTDAFRSHGIDPDRFLSTLPIDARLPWDHIDVGLEEGFLAREYRKAMRSRLSPPCGKAAGMFVHHKDIESASEDSRRLVCYDCGVACDLTQMRSERLTFLETLGATRAEASEVAPPAPVVTLRTKAKSSRPPARIAQGHPERIRLRFAKLGPAAYRGHLDLVKVIPRILRRAGVPLYYSQGFHPKPEMTFGPALSLGFLSLSEYVDVKYEPKSAFDPSDGLVAKLNAVTESGLTFLAAAPLGGSDPRISRVIDEAVYVCALATPTLEALGLDEAELRHRIDERAQCDSLKIVRRIKTIAKTVDVKQYLIEAQVGVGLSALRGAGLIGRVIPLRLRLKITGSGAANPREVLSVLVSDSGRDPIDAVIVREELLAQGTAPHDLDVLRHVRTQHSPARSAHG